MYTKTKQRLVGLLVLLAILAIFLPLVFHNSQPAIEIKSVAIPPKPEVNIAQKAHQQEQVELAPKPITVAPNAELTLSKPKVVKKSEPAATPAAFPAKNRIESVALRAHLKKDKARAVSEQKGLSRFMEQPKAWCVQLGTFSDAANANALLALLRKKGYDAYSRPLLNDQGDHLVRVYVGPEIQKESALQLQNKLQKSVKLKGVVRKYKTKI